MQCDIFIREVQSECQKMNSGHISILSSHDPGKVTQSCSIRQFSLA